MQKLQCKSVFLKIYSQIPILGVKNWVNLCDTFFKMQNFYISSWNIKFWFVCRENSGNLAFRNDLQHCFYVIFNKNAKVTM